MKDWKKKLVKENLKDDGEWKMSKCEDCKNYEPKESRIYLLMEEILTSSSANGDTNVFQTISIIRDKIKESLGVAVYDEYVKVKLDWLIGDDK